MLLQSGHDVTVHTTTCAGDAERRVRDSAATPCGAFDTLVIVSGDGLLSEVVNGVMARPDWQPFLAATAFAHVPAGSGNGLAATIAHASDEFFGPLQALFLVCKGHARPLDLFTVQQPQEPMRYGFLSLSWGIVADADFESEKWRCCGGARFTMSGLERILCLRKYEAVLQFLPAEDVTGADGRVVVPAHTGTGSGRGRAQRQQQQQATAVQSLSRSAHASHSRQLATSGTGSANGAGVAAAVSLSLASRPGADAAAAAAGDTVEAGAEKCRPRHRCAVCLAQGSERAALARFLASTDAAAPNTTAFAAGHMVSAGAAGAVPRALGDVEAPLPPAASPSSSSVAAGTGADTSAAPADVAGTAAADTRLFSGIVNMYNYLFPAPDTPTSPGEAGPASREAASSAAAGAEAAEAESGCEHWVSMHESDFTLLWAMNVTHAASGMHSGPESHLGDGYLDLMFTRSISCCSLLGLMTAMESGAHLAADDLQSVKVKALRLDPTLAYRECIISLDGERLPVKPAELRVWRKVINVICR
jgi:diacylglycerol kinase family enzyme